MSDSSATPPPEVSEEEVERLRQENEQLKDQLDETPRHGSRGRSILSAFIIIIACLLAPLSITAVWANSTVSDTNRFVETFAPLASDADIQAAVSARVSDEIFKYVNIEELTNEAISGITSNPNIPPKATAALDALAGPIASGIESFISDQITKIVQSPQFAQAWTEALTVAQTQLVAALEGEREGAVSVENDQVILNLGDVVTQVKDKLVARGFTVAEKIPAVDTTIVLFESDSISKAQAAYSALNAIGFWFPIVVALLAILAVFLANFRHVALIGLGVGLLISMGISALLVAMFKTGYMSALPATVNREAAETLYDQLTLFLRQALETGIALGVLLALAGIFVGPGRFGSAVRRLCVNVAASIQAHLYSWGATMTTVRGFVRQSAVGLRIALLVIAIVFVIVQQYKTAPLLIWTTVVLLIALFIVQILASDSGETDDEANAALDTKVPA